MNKPKNITRKEAIKKIGYVAFSAATMMVLLNDPLRAQAPHSPPGGGGPPWGDPGPPDNPGPPGGEPPGGRPFDDDFNPW